MPISKYMKRIAGFNLKSFFGVIKANAKTQYDQPTVFIKYNYPMPPSNMVSGLMLKSYYYDLENKPNKVGITQLDYDETIVNHLNPDNTITCHYCGQDHKVENINFDHYIPFYFGGTSVFQNLKLSCTGCNLMKGSIHPENMTVTFGVFTQHLQAEAKPKALGILVKAAKLEMSAEEAELVAKLTKKELAWREALKQNLLAKGKITQEEADQWNHGLVDDAA